MPGGSRDHANTEEGREAPQVKGQTILLPSVTEFTDIFFDLSENRRQGGIDMDKKTAGYRAFATRIVTRGAFTAEQTHLRVRHTVERALLVTVVAIAFFLFAHH
jgi:hypothetical protein